MKKQISAISKPGERVFTPAQMNKLHAAIKPPNAFEIMRIEIKAVTNCEGLEFSTTWLKPARKRAKPDGIKFITDWLKSVAD